MMLGICFLRGVPEDVVGEIGDGEKEGCGGVVVAEDKMIGDGAITIEDLLRVWPVADNASQAN